MTTLSIMIDDYRVEIELRNHNEDKNEGKGRERKNPRIPRTPGFLGTRGFLGTLFPIPYSEQSSESEGSAENGVARLDIRSRLIPKDPLRKVFFSNKKKKKTRNKEKQKK